MNRTSCSNPYREGKEKVVDAITKDGKIHKSFDKPYMNMIGQNYKIYQIRERIYINKFGMPIVLHRISGGNVHQFAKAMGLSLLSIEQTRELEHMLKNSACTFLGENIIYKKEGGAFR